MSITERISRQPSVCLHPIQRIAAGGAPQFRIPNSAFRIVHCAARSAPYTFVSSRSITMLLRFGSSLVSLTPAALNIRLLARVIGVSAYLSDR